MLQRRYLVAVVMVMMVVVVTDGDSIPCTCTTVAGAVRSGSGGHEGLILRAASVHLTCFRGVRSCFDWFGYRLWGKPFPSPNMEHAHHRLAHPCKESSKIILQVRDQIAFPPMMLCHDGQLVQLGPPILHDPSLPRVQTRTYDHTTCPPALLA